MLIARFERRLKNTEGNLRLSYVEKMNKGKGSNERDPLNKCK